MKFKNFLIYFIFLALFSLILFSNVLAVSDSTKISAEVTGVPAPICNYNEICEPGRGETAENCSDCVNTSIHSVPFPLIYDLLIEKVTLNSAEISWKTNKDALCKIFWGRTAEYKAGGIAEIYFGDNHLLKLIGLEEQTKYHFKVSCTDKLDTTIETTDYEFMTLTPADHIPPANVKDFEAIAGDKKIELKWKNPSDFDFQGVRIIRNDRFYPSDISDGEIVYEGNRTSFTDTDVENGRRYYYTAFSFDRNRNYSSGAVVSAVPQPAEGPIAVPPLPPEEIVPVGPLPEGIEKIKLEDFDFFVGGIKVFPKDGKIEGLEPDAPFTISIKYEKVPEVLKTIMATLEKENKFFSFLLRINEEKTVYEATIIPPEEAGIYPMAITILDYKNRALKKIKGAIAVEKAESQKIIEGLSFWARTPKAMKILYNFVVYSLAAIIIYIISAIIKRIFRKEKVKYGY